MRIGLLALGGWLVAAVLTVGVSWSAISVVRDAVVVRAEVDSSLPAPEEPSVSPTPAATTARPSPTTPAARIALGSGRGGTATVRCVDGRPAFVNITPKQGYGVERDDDGTEVKFRSAAGRTEMTASCAGGVPRVTVEDRDEGGSGRGRGGDDD